MRWEQNRFTLFKFIQPYLGPAAITAWLDGLNWHDPWLESNKVMFLTSFLIHCGELEAAHSIFDWLDVHQDLHTGYWGTQHGANLLNAMAGAFHFYFLYLYLQRPFQYLEQIIDSTLSLQQPDGLYDRAAAEAPVWTWTPWTSWSR